MRQAIPAQSKADGLRSTDDVTQECLIAATRR